MICARLNEFAIEFSRNEEDGWIAYCQPKGSRRRVGLSSLNETRRVFVFRRLPDLLRLARHSFHSDTVIVD